MAAFAAADYLPAFYPGTWVLFDNIVAYDSDGLPAAYIVIFRDPNCPIEIPDTLGQWLQEQAGEIAELDRKLTILNTSKNSPKEEKDILVEELQAIRRSKLRKSYCTSDFVTVVTGATVDSKVLIRCYRGLPEVLVKKPNLQNKLQAKYPNRDFKLNKILFLGPADLRYEIKQIIPKENEWETAETNGALSDLFILSSQDGRVISMNNYKTKFQKIQAEKPGNNRPISYSVNKRQKEPMQKLDRSTPYPYTTFHLLRGGAAW